MPHNDPLFDEMFMDAPGSEVDLKKKHRTLSEIRCNVPFVDDPIYASVMDDDSEEGDTALVQQIEASNDFEKMFGMGLETSEELTKQARTSTPSVTVLARPGSISVARTKSANLLRLEKMLRRSRELRQWTS
jgi:hypothetical protein